MTVAAAAPMVALTRKESRLADRTAQEALARRVLPFVAVEAFCRSNSAMMSLAFMGEQYTRSLGLVGSILGILDVADR